MSYERFIDDGDGLIITPPVKKDAEDDVEKYNTCHGAKGRFCGTGGGGLGGGLSMETEGSRIQPGSGGGGGVGGKNLVSGARDQLKPLIGKRVPFNAKVEIHSKIAPDGSGNSMFKNVNIQVGGGKQINVEHAWVDTPKGHPLRNIPEGGKVKLTGVVRVYPKRGGYDIGFKDLQNIEVRKGIDVGDVHVAGPSWKGKKRSEMTKEELAACEKERAACPKVKKSVDIAKFDDEQRLIYGIVLVPDVEDLQGDICSKEDIQEAAHEYLVKSRLIKAQHRAPTDAEVVECYIAPIDIPIGKGIAPAGSWVMVTKVNSEAMWTAIKKGEITGYSIGGRGTREEI